MRDGNLGAVILVLLAVLNGAVWFRLLSSSDSKPSVYFLDVGQGDATLVSFPGGVKILVDAGPGSKVLRSLEDVGVDRRYIDLGIVSHPQLDHFNGFNYLLERYDFGAFILNGRGSDSSEWEELMGAIKSSRIPVIVLAAGDVIKYRENKVDFLSPDMRVVQSGEVNDTSFVNMVATPDFRLLLTGDIGFSVEKYLVEKFGDELRAQVLKVPHHGSKYSTSQELLTTVDPEVAVVEVGENRYGHPTIEVLNRLSDLETKIFRTDLDGSIRMTVEENKLLFH